MKANDDHLQAAEVFAAHAERWSMSIPNKVHPNAAQASRCKDEGENGDGQ
jgi:hypothetical protein